LIDDYPTCAVLLSRIEKEAEEVITGMAKCLVSDSRL